MNSQHYTLLEEIGKGASSYVFCAQEVGSLQQYALKAFLNKDPIKDVHDHTSELTIQSNLNHSRILKAYTMVPYSALSNLDKINPFSEAILTEFAPNGDLLELLQTLNRLNGVLARTYAHQLIEAVSYLHKMGVAHCDIKSEKRSTRRKLLLQARRFRSGIGCV